MKNCLQEERRMKDDPNYVPSYKRNTRSGSCDTSGQGGAGSSEGTGNAQPPKKKVPAGHDTCPYCERNFCIKAYDRYKSF